jgi:hypothetical protein
VLFVVLAVSRNPLLHVGGASLVGLALVSQMLLQAI